MTKSTSYGTARPSGGAQRAGTRPDRAAAARPVAARPVAAGPVPIPAGEQATRAARTGRKIAAAGLISSAALALPATAALTSPASAAVPSPTPGSVILTAHDVFGPGTQFSAYTVGQPDQAVQSAHPARSAEPAQAARGHTARPAAATRNQPPSRTPRAGDAQGGSGPQQWAGQSASPSSPDLPVYRQSQRHFQQLRGSASTVQRPVNAVTSVTNGGSSVIQPRPGGTPTTAQRGRPDGGPDMSGPWRGQPAGYRYSPHHDQRASWQGQWPAQPQPATSTPAGPATSTPVVLANGSPTVASAAGGTAGAIVNGGTAGSAASPATGSGAAPVSPTLTAVPVSDPARNPAGLIEIDPATGQGALVSAAGAVLGAVAVDPATGSLVVVGPAGTVQGTLAINQATGTVTYTSGTPVTAPAGPATGTPAGPAVSTPAGTVAAPGTATATGMPAGTVPWGLKGYGFEPYAAESPGNAVQALARFWSDHTAAILAAEEQFADRCHRVRYEDLVADPEAVADGIFRFIGVPPVQGISTACFAPERERLGPADYKIWHTSRITAGSVGRGWSLPAALITPPVTKTVNELADKLGYLGIDEAWGIAETAPDPRRPRAGASAAPVAAARAVDTRQMPRVFLVMGDLLQSGLFRVSDRFARRWGTFATESFVLVATSQAAGSARWRVDLAARTVTLTEASRGDEGSLGEAAWQLTGPADVWERVVRGTANLNVVLRRRELRYCDTGQGAPTTVTRIGMLADLLGITSWRSPDAPRTQPAQPVSVA